LQIFSRFFLNLSPNFKLMQHTATQFDDVFKLCSEIFQKKMKDYGAAWRVLRPSSLTDQILIKARRIRSIEQKGTQKIQDGVVDEFIGIVNYAAIALIQLELGLSDEIQTEIDVLSNKHTAYLQQAKTLMLNKNHDYDEAWRDMRVSSFTDLILMKLYRTKQIEDNAGKTLISEGVEANYFDMINYAVFALIQLVIEKK